MAKNKHQINQFVATLPSRLFFLFTFLFFFFFADHIFFYQEKTSLFIFSGDFLADNLNQPGGILVFLSKFLTSFYYYPITGALISSVIIWSIVVISLEITMAITGSKKVFIPFLAGLVLFCLQLNYRYMLYNNLGILLQLIFFLLYIKYLKRFSYVFLIPLLYFISGGFTWIFCIMYSVLLLLEKPEKWWLKLIILWLLSLIFIWLAKEFLFFQSVRTLLSFPYTDDGTGSQIRIFIPLVVVISFLPVFLKIRIRNPFRKKFTQNILTVSGSVSLLVILITISVIRYDRKTQHYFYVEKLFYENRFNDVIDYNIKYQSNNILSLYLNNIALCETGQLNDKLFHFRQSADGGTLFLKWDITGEIARRGGYFYYTIGMINEARRWAFENIVTRGMTPEGLKLIIRSDIINGDYKTANKYISVLKKTLFYRDEANGFKKLLFDDKSVESHPELGEKRRNKNKTDFIVISEDPVINIERILATDSTNRKAYEYKLAWLLLKKDYHSISYEWDDLEKHGFKTIPVHIEEAATAIKVLYTGQLPSPGNLSINPSTEIRFNRFLQTFQSYGNDLRAAEPALRKQFGNTFWYWTFYH